MNPKNRRLIYLFKDEKPTAVNLDHVTHMSKEGNRIIFNFYTTCLHIDMKDEEAATLVFDMMVKEWADYEMTDIVKAETTQGDTSIEK